MLLPLYTALGNRIHLEKSGATREMVEAALAAPACRPTCADAWTDDVVRRGGPEVPPRGHGPGRRRRRHPDHLVRRRRVLRPGARPHPPRRGGRPALGRRVALAGVPGRSSSSSAPAPASSTSADDGSDATTRSRLARPQLGSSSMTHVLSAVAWPYANGPRHIGHVAGFGVPSDVFSRYMRMAGHDVLMVSGTDEHGTPILIAADEAGRDRRGARRQEQPVIVEDLVDARALLRPLHPHHDPQPLRGRAGAVRDRATATATWSSRRRTARSPRRPAAPCPTATSRAPARSAGTTSARGDQCDNCGNQLDPTDLINPRSQDQRRDAGVRRDPALLPRPAGAGRRAGGVARRARGDRARGGPT